MFPQGCSVFLPSALHVVPPRVECRRYDRHPEKPASSGLGWLAFQTSAMEPSLPRHHAEHKGIEPLHPLNDDDSLAGCCFTNSANAPCSFATHLVDFFFIITELLLCKLLRMESDSNT
jgi:hypothetical protein